MSSMQKIVSCDTGFLIRLLNRNDPLHKNAKDYFAYYLQHGYTIRISTIVIAEFCVKDNVGNIPLLNFLVSPFNVNHAQHAGKCAAKLHELRHTGVKVVADRIIIQNDVKIMAQAHKDGSELYLTADSNSKVMYDNLHDEGLLSFDFIDIHTPLSQRNGELNFEE